MPGRISWLQKSHLYFLFNLDNELTCSSVSQFEAFFKRHGRPKNLKREEWRAVHAKLAELADVNFETRVRISGQILSKERLDRSKRYALSKTRHSYSSKSCM
jgi:hypothetical protein